MIRADGCSSEVTIAESRKPILGGYFHLPRPLADPEQVLLGVVTANLTSTILSVAERAAEEIPNLANGTKAERS